MSLKCQVAVLRGSFFYSIISISTSKWHNCTGAGLCGKIPERKTLAPANGERMLLDLRGRCGRRDRRLFTVLTPIVLLTTVSCSTLPADIQQPLLGFAECDLFSGLVTEDPRQQVLQQEELRRREQPSTSATPKVASVRAPNATSRPGSGDASKKANTPRVDVQKERQLFKEFLEWRGRQIDVP